MNIIKHRKLWYTISGILFLGSILVWIAFGLKFGLDFTGGSLMEVKYENVSRPEQAAVSQKLADLDLSLNVASTDADGYLLRFKHVPDATHQEILKRLAPDQYLKEGETLPAGAKVSELRYDSIGPSVGEELKKKSIYATFLILIAIMLFVAYSFRKVSYPVTAWKYGMAVLISLFHDVIITIGAFVLLGHFAGFEINTPFIAALLTILGYSVNDTIVVLDRVRENLHREEGTFEEIVEKSVKQTFARSVNTSVTTLLALAAILAFGGTSIRDFIITLIFGIIIGTYSSIFLAAPILVTWQQLDHKLKKGAE